MPKKVKNKVKTSKADHIVEEGLLSFARRNYYEYGMSVIEDRAIPDAFDGQLPVTRRGLYSAYDMGVRSNAKYVKAARVVGDTMGRFHPHGDSSIYSSLVNMAKLNPIIPYVDGMGNWGTFSEPRPSAMRYTEMRLSKFADEVLFNKFYTPVMFNEWMVPNYDGSFTEPLRLPALLPVSVLNGKSGVAPGATTDIPAFTSKSVLKTLSKIYGGEEITAKLLYNNLEFTTDHGGVEVEPATAEAKQDRMGVFKGTRGRVLFKSTTSWNERTLTLTITKFANVGSILSKPKKKNDDKEKKETGLLDRLLDIEGVADARDDSTKTDRHAVVNVVLKKGLTPKMQAAILKHIRKKILTKRENYVLNFTERYVDSEGQAAARMKPMSIVTFFTEWVKWRIELERKACAHWMVECKKRIRLLELMLLAVDNLDIIFKALKQKFTREELDHHLAKKLKIKVEEANVISGMRVYQLQALEKSKLLGKKKEEEKEFKTLETRQKKPFPFMIDQLKSFPLPEE
jgi:DNA gyrase/topoisomerase IV subunit A